MSGQDALFGSLLFYVQVEGGLGNAQGLANVFDSLTLVVKPKVAALTLFLYLRWQSGTPRMGSIL